MLRVAALTSRSRLPSVQEEVTLCRELRTSPLPAAHVPVGYCWQHSRSCHSEKCMTVTPATSCRTRTPRLSCGDRRPTLVAAGCSARLTTYRLLRGRS